MFQRTGAVVKSIFKAKGTYLVGGLLAFSQMPFMPTKIWYSVPDQHGAVVTNTFTGQRVTNTSGNYLKNYGTPFGFTRVEEYFLGVQAVPFSNVMTMEAKTGVTPIEEDFVTINSADNQQTRVRSSVHIKINNLERFAVNHSGRGAHASGLFNKSLTSNQQPYFLLGQQYDAIVNSVVQNKTQHDLLHNGHLIQDEITRRVNASNIAKEYGVEIVAVNFIARLTQRAADANDYKQGNIINAEGIQVAAQAKSAGYQQMYTEGLFGVKGKSLNELLSSGNEADKARLERLLLEFMRMDTLKETRPTTWVVPQGQSVVIDGAK